MQKGGGRWFLIALQIMGCSLNTATISKLLNPSAFFLLPFFLTYFLGPFELCQRVSKEGANKVEDLVAARQSTTLAQEEEACYS